MEINSRDVHRDAPALLIVPAGVVHGFNWHEETVGAVVTVSVRHLSLLDSRYPGLVEVFERAAAVYPDPAAIEAISARIGLVMRELGWSVPGHSAAVDAALLGVLVETLRSSNRRGDGLYPTPSHHKTLVARFRQRIDERFRLREAIATHAEALGTSESQLRVACARIASRSPAAMLDQRAMLEARRALIYTNLSIAEIGYSIGFADPAYFTRFFTRHAEMSPRRDRPDT